MKNKKIISIIISLLAAIGMTSCGIPADSELTNVHSMALTADKSEALKDNTELYINDDNTSVKVMYITTRPGTDDTNTNHTWGEINTYSDRDYEAMGVERFENNILIQEGDERGPFVGEGALGYGVDVNATIRIRGQSSTRANQKNYRIALDGESWNSQKVINLYKSEADYIRYTNKLMYDLMKNIDNMVPMRTQFVHLYVKDAAAGATDFVDYGLYTQIEQPNKRFLESHGLDKKGQLYKAQMFEFYRYNDSIRTKDDPNYDVDKFEQVLEIQGSDDHEKLIAMLEDLNNTDKDIKEVVAKWFNRENLYTWMAFQILMGNIDSECHNFMLYSPSDSNTFYILNWDCDGAFVQERQAFRNGAVDVGWQQGMTNFWGSVLFKRVLKDNDFRKEFDVVIKNLKEQLCSDATKSMASSYADVVRPYLFSNPDVSHTKLGVEEFDLMTAAIPSWIEANYNHYFDDSYKPMPFFIGEPIYQNNKTILYWEGAHNFGGGVITYHVEMADNVLFENKLVDDTISAASDLNVSYVYKDVLPEGDLYLRVTATNEAGWSIPAFDYLTTKDTGRSQKNYGVKKIQ